FAIIRRQAVGHIVPLLSPAPRAPAQSFDSALTEAPGLAISVLQYRITNGLVNSRSTRKQAVFARSLSDRSIATATCRALGSTRGVTTMTVMAQPRFSPAVSIAMTGS